jgi:phosphinothricin acetyltransferase
MREAAEAIIRAVTPADAPALAAIYNHYVLNTIITFEETPVPDEEMARRIRKVTARFPWFVAEQDGAVTGYAYVNTWRTRAAYRHSVESTVYLRPDAVGRGLGRRLFETLIAECRERGLHTIIGGIALPNPASIAMHRRLGFHEVARFREVGRKFNRWIDVAFWQLML